MKISRNRYGLFVIAITSLWMAACDFKNKEQNKLSKERTYAAVTNMEDMQSAYKGEKTATAKYEAFSKKAEAEGYHSIAVLYRAVSTAESIHAINHQAVIEDAGDTVPLIKPVFIVKSKKENLYDDIHGEGYEEKTMYPQFLRAAEAAGNQVATVSLTYAMKTEAKHKLFFEQALGVIASNTVNSLPSTYYVCPVCGNTYSTLPKHCDFSLTAGEKFYVFQ